MSEDPNANGDNLPQAELRERRQRRISTVWIIPVVAAIIGGGLAWRTLSERGPEITISFASADGLEAGKTLVRYRNVVVGTVEDIELSDDLGSVTATVRMMHASARRHLGPTTEFWVVRPRISAQGISGLSTLVSGDYIALEPGPPDGKFTRHFEGLLAPPLDESGKSGLAIELVAPKLGGLGVNSPIYYREVQVGAIQSIRLADDGSSVVIEGVIESAYANHVYENSEFWNASGIDISASITKGIDFDMESLRSLIAGGVSFTTSGKPGKQATPGTRFTLRPHQKHPRDGPAMKRGMRVVVEATRLGSLKTGDAVYYREEQVGQILSHQLHDDARTIGVLLHIDDPYGRLVRTNTVFWNASGISADLGLTGLHIHTESLESILGGGIAFATPDKPGARAQAGSVFKLEPEGKDKWREWSPSIWLGSRAKSSAAVPEASGAGKGKADEGVLHHHKGDEAGDSGSHHWFGGLFHKG